MAAGLRGDLSSIRAMKRSVAALPITLRHAVAADGAPALTAATREAFAAGRSVYGEARPLGVSGKTLDLYVTGAVSRQLRFQNYGTVIKCVLEPKYSRYLIGKYGVLPNGALPASWSTRLGAIIDAMKAARLAGPA